MSRRKGNSSRNNPMMRIPAVSDRFFNGGPFTPAIRPPAFTGQPWNACKVFVSKSTDGKAAKMVTSVDLSKSLTAQLGLEAGNFYDLRVRSISCWMREVGHLTLMPANFVSGSAVELCRIDGISTSPSTLARCGYSYPAHIYASPVTTNVTTALNIFSVQTSVVSIVDSVIDLEWRGANTTFVQEETVFTYTKPVRKKKLRDLINELEELELTQDDDGSSFSAVG